MLNPFGRYSLVKNFPKNHPLHKKIMNNIIFFLTGIIIHPRKNGLTRKDMARARFAVRKGDIILAGNLKVVLHSLIQEPVTHSGLYIGGGRVIHSNAVGVSTISLSGIFQEYDTLAILRIPQKTKCRSRIIRNAIRFAQSQYGKPYDFDFKAGLRSFFCTKLVNESFKHAGYRTGLSSVRRSRGVIKKLERHLHGAVDALHPINFLKSRFQMVYLSHNLGYLGGKLAYHSEPAQRQHRSRTPPRQNNL